MPYRQLLRRIEVARDKEVRASGSDSDGTVATGNRSDPGLQSGPKFKNWIREAAAPLGSTMFRVTTESGQSIYPSRIVSRGHLGRSNVWPIIESESLRPSHSPPQAAWAAWPFLPLRHVRFGRLYRPNLN
jgi:hypothetical protein